MKANIQLGRGLMAFSPVTVRMQHWILLSDIKDLITWKLPWPGVKRWCLSLAWRSVVLGPLTRQQSRVVMTVGFRVTLLRFEVWTHLF